MRISETKILDVTKKNIDEKKQKLAENVIATIYPLLNTVYQQKQEKFQALEKETDDLKKQLLLQKQKIEGLFENKKKKQKISSVLDQVQKMIDLKLVTEGQNKVDTIVFLKMIEKLSLKKLQDYLTESNNIIRKRKTR